MPRLLNKDVSIKIPQKVWILETKVKMWVKLYRVLSNILWRSNVIYVLFRDNDYENFKN